MQSNRIFFAVTKTNTTMRLREHGLLVRFNNFNNMY